MGYVEQNLMPNEKVMYRTSLHWITFLMPAVFTLLFLFMALAISTTGEPGSGMAGIVILILLLPFAGLLFLARFITWKTSEFAVTNQRLIVKVGWIRRNTLELLLKKVEAVSVDQGIFGRMLDYGNIVVTGTGGVASPFAKIASPMVLRTKVNSLIADLS